MTEQTINNLIFPFSKSHLKQNFDKKDVEFTLKENGDVEWKFPDTQVGVDPNWHKLAKKATNISKLPFCPGTSSPL